MTLTGKEEVKDLKDELMRFREEKEQLKQSVNKLKQEKEDPVPYNIKGRIFKNICLIS